VTGGGNYCSGGAGVHIGISGSQAGTGYRLYNGTTAIGTAITGTGSAIDFGLQTAAGVYTILGTNTTTSCTHNMSGSVMITVVPVVVPSVSMTSALGDTVCVGTTTMFNATAVNGGSAPAWQWIVNGVSVSSGAAYYSYMPVNGDVVQAVLTSNATCAVPDTASAAVVMTVKDLLIPTVTITAHPGTGITVGANDTFVATVTNGGLAPAYQWKIHGTAVPGATNATFIWSSFANGDVVSCVVTSSGMCGGQTGSNLVTLTVTNNSGVGVKPVTGEGVVQVLPNPNKGDFTIRGTLGVITDEEVTIEITDMLGQVVYQEQVMKLNGKLDERVQLSSTIANGMYMLTLYSGSEHKVVHMVIEE